MPRTLAIDLTLTVQYFHQGNKPWFATEAKGGMGVGSGVLWVQDQRGREEDGRLGRGKWQWTGGSL